MTENEAIEVLALHFDFLKESWKPYPDRKVLDALRVAISSIREIQQYRANGTVKYFRECANILNEAETDNLSKIIDEWLLYQKIGTVEECREARERQKEKKVKNRKLLRDFHNRPYSVRGDCPNCGSEGLLATNTDYCNACGQKLDWSE